jgi:hypothetical protein
MDNASQTLEKLRDALEKLSPRELAAWTGWVESRFTERLRVRQEHGRAPSPTTGPEPDEDNN